MSTEPVTTVIDLVGTDSSHERGNAIDIEVCAGATCDRCGHKGLSYAPYRSRYGSYIAVAECPKCGHAVEF